MSSKPERIHLTMTGDWQAFDEVISCLFPMLLFLQLTEFSVSGFAWINVYHRSLDFLYTCLNNHRAKCTKSYYVISWLWEPVCFLLTVSNVLFQSVLVIDTGFLWTVPGSLFLDPGKSWLSLITIHAHSHTCPHAFYLNSVSPSRIFSPKTELGFCYLLCPLPNRGHNILLIYILVMTWRS